MASLSQQVPLPSMVIKVEVLSARRALEFALEIGFDHIVLEDLEILFKVCRNLAQYGHLTQDIPFLSLHFSPF